MILKKLTLLLILLLSVPCFSQVSTTKSFTLEWGLETVLRASNGAEVVLPLVEGQTVNQDGLPIFGTNWEVTTGTRVANYELINVVYENLSAKYLKNISLDKLNTTLQSTFVISNYKSNKSASLTIIPLVKDGQTVKRVVSFDISYRLSNVFARNAATNVIEDSPLSAGTWYKFSVSKTGVFKIDANFLNELGISTAGLDPRNIRIFGNGGAMLPNLNSEFRYANLQENDIYVQGEGDGSFDGGDYILFYAQGPHNWETPDENNISHKFNIFSDKAYYFITVNNGVGARVSNKAPVESAATDQVATFTDYLFFEEDKVNLYGTGQQWFGDSFANTNIRTYNFNFPNLDTSKEVAVKVRGVAESSVSTSMQVQVNSTNATTLNFSAISGVSFIMADDAEGSGNVSVSSSNLEVKLTYNNSGNPSADAHLDYIDVIADRFLVANGAQFQFRNFVSNEPAKVLEYTITNKSNISMLWDVTDPIHPEAIEDQADGGTDYSFKSNSGVLGEYVVLNTSDYYTPQILSNSSISNQNLHGLRDVEYVVVARDEFASQAQRLVDYHSANSGLNSELVLLNEIYNEFGSGAPDITAIRDFVKFLYDNASNDDTKIKYLCLFGDSSYDYKDRVPNNNNIVPVYQSYKSYSLVYSFATDDYYGMMDSNEGLMTSSDKQDVATGRILVSTNQQAEDVVNKILNYYSEEGLGGWKNDLTLFTDDLENASEYVFQLDMEIIADLIVANKPQFNINKIYADSYVQEETPSGGRYPDVNLALSNTVEKGSLVIDYFGHGGESGLGHEYFLTIPDIQSWVNFDKLPLFITVTCDFSRFDNPARFTAGEEMIANRNGGSASLISTTREVLVNYGRGFNNNLIQKILDFGDEDYTIAEALMHAKNETPSFGGQHFFIFSLGDPAMKLGIPKPSINVTEINDQDVTVYRDTLKALTKMKISGQVTDAMGTVLTNYNGVLSTSIFDKKTEKQTLNNDGFTDNNGNPLIMTFDVQNSSVFKGDVAVSNGLFSYEFVVPKDIKTAYGKAKISLYAHDNIGSKGGYDVETVIGGINDNAPEDTEGPEVSLFMNDLSFLDGGNTSAVPNLIARFSDENGINTSVGSIGHDIVAIIDGDETNQIKLNDFYETELNDYTSGQVVYSLRELEAGPHTITVKVWDTYNNSSEATLNFTVVAETEFILENVLNYPNPFVNYTEFWFNHNQPNAALDVKIYIYTVSGKLVKAINQQVQTSGGLSRSITWDGMDDFGEKVGKGVYVYSVIVTNTDTGVTAEKYEKLVILQ